MGYAVAKTFEELEVYKRAFSISLDIHRESLLFPKIEQYALGDQVRRASKSICANIAEGFAKQRSSQADFRRFLLMAMGSSNEMLVWINYCKELGYIDLEKAIFWREEYMSVGKMINALYSR
ncbi:MAG: four helix bundle protein [Rhodospirillales bacterium]|nr:four helix bundle protein [Rhodospirillales bacterium]MCB9995615.1 four helix bundle protein [Rhodospirillales bacterium]